ncbi:MAG: hypothetical protein ACREJU_06195 [Nitrospiraceae bacterium]
MRHPATADVTIFDETTDPAGPIHLASLCLRRDRNLLEGLAVAAVDCWWASGASICWKKRARSHSMRGAASHAVMCWMPSCSETGYTLRFLAAGR